VHHEGLSGTGVVEDAVQLHLLPQNLDLPRAQST
jgi:hypothetical protein